MQLSLDHQILMNLNMDLNKLPLPHLVLSSNSQKVKTWQDVFIRFQVRFFFFALVHMLGPN